MRYSIFTIFLVMTISALVAWRYSAYVNNPVQQLKALGAGHQFVENEHHVVLGLGFDRSKMQRAVKLIGEMKRPCSISITGNTIKDADLTVLDSIDNVPAIFFSRSTISNAGVLELAGIKCLKQVTIENCMNVDNSGIVQLEKTRPRLIIKGWWIERQINGGPPTLTGR